MKKILIIDDDKDLANVIKDFFVFAKCYEVLTCFDGKEGMKKIYDWEPDLIILDVMLPEIDGFEICTKIKDIVAEKRPKIVLLTILNNILDQMNSNWLDEIKADGFVSKPINMIDLRITVDGLLMDNVD